MAEDERDGPDDDPHFGEQLAYNWDLLAKKVEQVWRPALVPPKSFRAVADKVAAQKKDEAEALRAKRGRGKIKP